MFEKTRKILDSWYDLAQEKIKPDKCRVEYLKAITELQKAERLLLNRLREKGNA